MRLGALALATACASVVSGCGEDEPSRSDFPVAANASPASIENSVEAVSGPKPAPRYDEREGDTYFYIGDVSEEDRKQGKALGAVVGFRYFGLTDGVHRLGMVSDAGAITLRYECPVDCKIIKRRGAGAIERLPYEPNSIIGAAFADALAGNLEVAKQASKPAGGANEAPVPGQATIPVAFRGEWNEDPQACGTGSNPTRLTIGTRDVRFTESEGRVVSVTTPNARTLQATLTMAGDGETWTDTFTWVLSGSGEELRAGDLVRRRCPSRLADEAA